MRTLSWFVAVCMVLTMLPSVGAYAADDVTYLLDTSKKSAITDIGFEADSSQANATQYCAKWETDQTKEFYLKDFPDDITNHSAIDFSLMADSNSVSTLMLFIGSENDATDGIDYYSKTISLAPGKWETFHIEYSDLGDKPHSAGVCSDYRNPPHGDGME